MATERTTVETFSSYRYAVEPRAFMVRGERHEVRTVLRTWRTPGSLHFYIQDDRENLLELQYEEQSDTWWLNSNTIGD